MDTNLTLAIIFGLILTFIYFIEDLYDDKLKFKIHPSLIAGISITYFFILVLPEIAANLPDFLIGNLEFLFILIGFAFFHVSEKLILQRVEKTSQKKVRKLIKKEQILEEVEDNMEDIITREIQQEHLNEIALKDLVNTLSSLHDQSREIKDDIKRYKFKIEKHLEKELFELRFFTDISYHLLIGFILYNLLLLEFLAGILFFIFVFFRAIITNKSVIEDVAFTDLDIVLKYQESKVKKLIVASSPIMGACSAFVLDLILPIHNKLYLEFIYILYSIISGIILYTIVREVIPKKEKGNVLYFIIGVMGLAIIILMIEVIRFMILIS